MINENEIIKYLDVQFEKAEVLHVAHKKRVAKAIKWFNDNLLDKSVDSFAGSKVKVKGITYVCLENDFIGFPIFECYFIVMPYNGGDGRRTGHEIRRVIMF